MTHYPRSHHNHMILTSWGFEPMTFHSPRPPKWNDRSLSNHPLGVLLHLFFPIRTKLQEKKKKFIQNNNFRNVTFSDFPLQLLIFRVRHFISLFKTPENPQLHVLFSATPAVSAVTYSKRLFQECKQNRTP